LILIIRIQIKLKPYKREENNWIELMALIAGTTTMYAGFIFTLEDGPIFGFYQMAIIIVFLFNGYFIVHWTFLLMCSVEWNNHNYQRFLKIFALILCQKYHFQYSTHTEGKSSFKITEVPSKKAEKIQKSPKVERKKIIKNSHKKLIK
jgi:hypothetical protein